MARNYWLLSTASDLTGGADFTNLLAHNYVVGTPTATQYSIAGNATETSFGFTAPLEPGTAGSITGNYTVLTNITVANSSVFMSVGLDRVNSTGTVQTSTAATAEQALAAAGEFTFTFTNANLGTFAITDRLRVRYIFRNSNMGGQLFTMQFNTAFGATNETIVQTPFAAKIAVVT